MITKIQQPPIKQHPQKSIDLPLVATPWPVQGAWRYADYLRLPDDGRRYEVIEGVLYVANAPSYDHQFTAVQVTTELNLFVRSQKLGVVLSAPFEVHLSESSRPVQPDVFFLRTEQKPIPGSKIFEGTPTLIVEVISPSSIRLDRQVKFDAYEAAGVAEYWLINPKSRAVEVYTLSSGEYALLGEYTREEQIESNVLPGLRIITNTLFSS